MMPPCSTPLRTVALSLLAFALPDLARAQTTETEPRLEELVTQPLADVNLKRKEPPKALLIAGRDPYALPTPATCAAITNDLLDLRAALGPDFDEIELDEEGRKRREGAASAARGLVASLIPFRFLIRELSGASQAERDYRDALYAGIVRRGFLKGLGQAQGCSPPARPLTPLEGAAQAAEKIARGDNGE